MDEDRLNTLLSIWQQRQAEGRDVQLTELCGDCPELAAALQERIGVLRQMNALAQPGGAPDGANTARAALVDATVNFETDYAQLNGADTDGPRGAIPGALPASVPGYEILAELGRGGMGVVYKARQQNLKRTVALKMILAGAHAGAEAKARFEQEAETIARLKHANVVQVYDFGRHEGKPYFALEYLAGGTLAAKLHGEPQAPAQAAQMVATLARALQAAHDQGIVHRDLKPANVLLSADGTAKVTDFGLAKQGDSAMTASGAVMGTPSYMSPEQAEGKIKEIGPACDIYALGAILYEMLTGRPPFKGASVVDTLQMLTTAEPVPPSQLQPKVPRDLETVCLKCLRKDPRKRYVSADALADDLCRFLNNEPIAARPVGQAERLMRLCRRKPLAASLLLGLMTVLAVGVPWLMFLTVLAESRRVDAEEKRLDAETAQQRAVEQKEIAQQSQIKAEQASAAAEQAQKKAEEASNTAIKQEQIARVEAEKSREFSDLLLGVFESADPTGMQGYTFASAQVGSSQLSAREILDRAVAKLQKLKGRPQIQATHLASIGNVYRSLGLYKKAGELLERAYALRRKAYGAEHEEIADSLYLLGWLYHEQGQFPTAKKYYQDALKMRRNLLGADSPKVTTTVFNLAWLAALTGEHPESEKLFLDVIARRQKEHGTAEHRDVAIAKLGLAILYLDSGQVLKASLPGTEAIGIFRRLSSNEKIAEAVGLFLQAAIWERGKQYATAESLLHKCAALTAGELGDKHPYLAIVYYQLGTVLEEQNKYTDAEKHYRHSLKIGRASVGLGHPKALLLAAAMGRVLTRKGAFAEAADLYEETVKAHQERFGADHPLVADVLVSYADLLGNRSVADKIKVLSQAVDIYETGEKKYGAKAIHLNRALHNLSSACWQARSVGQGLQVGLKRKQLFPNDPKELYDTACEVAYLVQLVNQDAALDAGGRKKLADACTVAALDTLAQAIAKGFADPLRLQIDPRLSPISARPAFEALCRKLPVLDKARLRIHRGALTAKEPFDTKFTKARCKHYKVRLESGKTYQLDLLSVDFDAYLRVENEAGREKAFDDDSGGNFNARLVFTPAQSGEYRVIVTSFVANQTGAFVLAILEK
jgi:tetratricopeptide (TPR) repeat protein/tRNA A-37 threonylcarbamoyl transferase component Bud32